MSMANNFSPRRFALAATMLAAAWMTACGGAAGSGTGTGLSSTALTLSPPSAEIRTGDTVQFSVSGANNSAVTWMVNGVTGGNSTVGTVDTNGLYHSPATIPNPNSVQVQVKSNGGSSIASAVTVDNPVPVILSMLPTSVPVGAFTLSINGKGFANGAVVVFGSQFLPTTFISSTQLTATGNQSTSVPSGVPVTVLNPDPGSTASNAFLLQVGVGTGQVSANAASRFLEQSTWGPTPQLIAHVQQIGFQSFLTEQFGFPASQYPAPAQNAEMDSVQDVYFRTALTGADQVRQRVAFALSEIMVISAVKVNNPQAFVLWNNVLQKDSLGNYSQLLNDVTLSPAMGNYLDMVNNDKPNPSAGTTPNENYAREVMQLFSIGLDQLNPDGTPQLDSSGNPIPTYTQDTIEGFAHVFTGWSYPPVAGAQPQFWAPENYTGPMLPFDSNHDMGTKLLLNGYTVPAGGSATTDLSLALQNIFNHSNVGPFISKQLIQHLVTSNPNPAYVARVAAVFADNGKGVRGDLAAVVTAILLDGEARRGDDPTQVQAQDGHLKEPLLFMMNLLRMLNATSDGVNLANYASGMKQNPFFPQTVFNFFPPNWVIEGSTLLGPEFKILNTSTIINRVNFVNDLIYGSVGSTTNVSISNFVALASDPATLVDNVGTVLLHGNMSSNMRTALIDTVSAIPDNTRRAKAALYLAASSSQFQVSH